MDPLNGGLQARSAPSRAKAKACIFLTMLGGVSQMDTFDPKPALEKFDNTVMDWSKEKLTDQVNLFAKPRLILRVRGSSANTASAGWTFRNCSRIWLHASTTWHSSSRL